MIRKVVSSEVERNVWMLSNKIMDLSAYVCITLVKWQVEVLMGFCFFSSHFSDILSLDFSDEEFQ